MLLIMVLPPLLSVMPQGKEIKGRRSFFCDVNNSAPLNPSEKIPYDKNPVHAFATSLPVVASSLVYITSTMRI